MTPVSLFELNEFIRRVLALNLPEAIWVKAELAQVKSSRGHIYLQLVQKGEDEEGIVAQAEAVLWQINYRTLQKKFGPELNALLTEGMEVLMLARVDFHERYGLKLVIADFDPAYTMGKLEQKRRAIVRQLQQLNLLEKQRMLPLPLVLQKIAVLTAESAAGYQDFLDQLHANPYGYCFHTQLFQTAMQGNAVEKEMTAQLRKIIHYTGGFDAVVIIRGGGAKLDLAAFDNLELGKAIANFPYPVFTGIGHEVDETVLDMVAHAAFKTPTATADFILHRNMQFESSVLNHALEVKTLTNVLLNRSSTSLHQSLQFIDFQVKSKLRHQDLLLNYIEKEIPSALRRVFQKTKSRLDSLENTVTLLSPETALKRGFSIVTKEGKPVISSNELQLGDDLEILLQQGEILTTVKQVKK